MTTVQRGCRSKNRISSLHRSLRLSCTSPVASMPWSWKTDLAVIFLRPVQEMHCFADPKRWTILLAAQVQRVSEWRNLGKRAGAKARIHATCGRNGPFSLLVGVGLGAPKLCTLPALQHSACASTSFLRRFLRTARFCNIGGGLFHVYDA